jgi:hypothetical protein
MKRTVTGTIACVTLATVAGVSFAATPAQAIPPNCAIAAGYWIDGGHNIHAYNFLSCPDGETGMQPRIDRFVSPGVWQEVASGDFYADYYCNGFAFNRYRVRGRIGIIDQFENTGG